MVDFYTENGYKVFTEEFHLKRGSCCNSGCRHCPYPLPTEPIAMAANLKQLKHNLEVYKSDRKKIIRLHGEDTGQLLDVIESLEQKIANASS